MATNSVEKILQGAKDTLAKANKFTESVEGNPTSAFAPKKPEAPKIPQSHKEAPYSLAHEARSAGQGIAERAKIEAEARKSLE